MKPAYIVFALCTSLIVLSCKNNRFEAEIDKVHELNVTIDSIDAAIRGIDTTAVYNMLGKISHDLAFIQENYNDSITLEIGIILEKYHNIKKSNRDFRINYTLINENIIYTRDQLWRLEENLKINAWELSEGQGYVEDEADVVRKVNLELHSMMEGIEYANTHYEMVQPVIDSLLVAIQTNTNE